MSALLEYECRVCVDGYEVITFEEPWPEDDPPPSIETIRMLQPRSERTKRFDLFTSPSAFLEFAQTPDTLDAIKDFADRYGLLYPDIGPGTHQRGRDISFWNSHIRALRQTVELWQKSIMTGDFSKLIRAVQRKFVDWTNLSSSNVSVGLLLKQDPLSAFPRICIRPKRTLGSVSLGD
jgi:hypothetical protein